MATRTSTDDVTTTTSPVRPSSLVADGVSEVREAVGVMSRSMPEVARASRDFVDEAMRRIERGSDERISLGVTLSLGLAIGMLVGGAPRLLIAAALAPVAAMSLVLMDRRAKAGLGTRSTRAD
jgi:hypothetical protein